MAGRCSTPSSVDDGNGPVILSDTESVSSVASSTTGRRRRPVFKKKDRSKKQTDKNIFGPQLTVEELNHLRRDERNLAVELRARKRVLETLLLQDDLGDDMMASLLDVLIAVSKKRGDDAEEVFTFLASKRFINVHLLLQAVKCRMNTGLCSGWNILQKVISVLMAFFKFRSGNVEGIQMVAAVIHDTITYGLDVPDRKTYAKGLKDVTMILTNKGRDKEPSTENICNLPIFPTGGEVVDPDPTQLLDVTAEQGPSVKNFLHCHYRLLKEDIVQPLQAVISDYHQVKRRMGVHAAKKKCHIIEGVRLHEIITTDASKGVIFRVQFDTSSLENVSWGTTRLLSVGNMVCLSSNHFCDMIFGTVVQRDPQRLKQGFVDLRFFIHEDTGQLVSGSHFYMIDSRKCVEESYAILDAMRQIDPTALPLVQHVVYQVAENEQSVHVKKDPDLQYDVSSLLKEEHSSRKAAPRTWRTSLLKQENWPPTDQLCVDEHQLIAIRAALTNQLTIITGAPGTGKTHVGLKLIQLFVLNKHRWSPCTDSLTGENDGGRPLLFMCASEATLDEYLTGVSFFQRSRIVRWAGAYTRKALQEYQIENLRKLGASTAYEDQTFRERLEECKKRLGNVQANLSSLRTKMLPEEIMKLVMDGRHYKNLKAGKGPISCVVMLEWLLSNSCGDDLCKLQEDFPSNMSPLTSDGDAWFEQSLPFILDSQSSSVSVQTRNNVCKQLSSRDKMTDSESQKVGDVWRLPLKDRWRIYRYWIAKLEVRARERAKHIFKEMERISLDCQEMHDLLDESILRAATVIGMTASSAATNHKVLQRINPRVIIIEEGADILQSVTAGIIPSSCQQLIIIGENVHKVDEFQAVKKMAERHSIHASLMEQFVDSNYSVYELKTQHRLSPIASKISRQLFKYDYKNDQSVIELLPIKVLQHDVFFIDHNVQKSPAEYEVSFLLALFSHLLSRGFARKQISVLVSFPFQYRLFGNDLKDRLLTVDNFRGSNDIILFMCNGSERGSCQGGLLKDQRIRSLLSSARRGLYIIGNFSYLSSQCAMWARIIEEARRLEWLDSGLKLTCPHHPNKPITVSSVDGFQQLKDKRGCGLPCQARLDCGHGCKELCHDHDAERARIVCKQPCNRIICENGHKCTRTCSEPCVTTCREKVEKQLSCGHYQRLPCLLPPSHTTCRDKCERFLNCGHKCTGICGDPCKKETCVENTTKSDWPCKHTVQVRCCDGPETCPEPCNVILECGHPCSGTCGKCRRGRLHVVCQQPCGRTLVCGHSCESNCAAQCPPCTKQCENRCQHSECRKFCGEACIPCQEPCQWRCPHASCSKLCGEPCDRKPCDEPCNKNLPCGHPCIGMCGESCPTKCRVCNREEVTEILFGSEDEEDARFVQLEDCGHVIEVEALDQYMSMTQDTKDDITIQLKGCPKCKTPIRRNLRYGNIIKQTLADLENVKTKMRGSKKEIDQKMSELKVKISDLKSHRYVRRGFVDERDLQKLLEDLTQMKHLEKVLARLNRCAFLQAILDVRAKLSIGTTSSSFQLKTRKHAGERRLRELKNEIFNGELDKFTDQQMNDIQREISRANLQAGAMTALTRNMTQLNRSMQSSHLKAFDNVVNKETPFTAEDEARATRHLRKLKQEMGHVVLGITDQERVEIVKAIGLSQGHWYKCPKGHVYAIGECGGAMEETKCPECGANIGGGSHRLTAGNRVASEMDGATRAAWPTGDIGYDDYDDDDNEVEQEIEYIQVLDFDQEEIAEQFEIERQIREDWEIQERTRRQREQLANEARLQQERARQDRERIAREERERRQREQLANEARLQQERARQERERIAREQRERRQREQVANEARLQQERARQERERIAREERERRQREQLANEARLQQEWERHGDRLAREARERVERENRERERRAYWERLRKEEIDGYERRVRERIERERRERQKDDEKCIIS